MRIVSTESTHSLLCKPDEFLSFLHNIHVNKTSRASLGSTKVDMSGNVVTGAVYKNKLQHAKLVLQD